MYALNRYNYSTLKSNFMLKATAFRYVAEGENWGEMQPVFCTPNYEHSFSRVSLRYQGGTRNNAVPRPFLQFRLGVR